MKLVDYGIHTEKSDIRAHVCVRAGSVYVFRTADAVRVLQNGDYKLRPAYQPGVSFATAMGAPVPLAHLPHVPVSAKSLISAQLFSPDDSTSIKGQKAVKVVTALIHMGWFPLLGSKTSEASDVKIQVSGIDVIVSGTWRIQVKCDYNGGCGPDCTGNLFLQVQECNPLRAT